MTERLERGRSWLVMAPRPIYWFLDFLRHFLLHRFSVGCIILWHECQLERQGKQLSGTLGKNGESSGIR